MTDAQSPSRSLSEIGHLFLSSVRERQTNGAPLPRRQPPARASLSVPTAPMMDVSIALTPKEFACVSAPQPAEAPQAAGGDEAELRFPPITAILGAHLNDKLFAGAKQYARHLAAGGERVGLIEVDGAEFRLMCFDRTPGVATDDSTDDSAAESFDARAMTDALDELSWDLDRWLLVLPNPRTCEARCLLRDVGHWVLLSTCDHDGVVGCYRTLKGLSENFRPRLSLALLDARDPQEAEKIHRKLAGVCGQFLGWELQPESPVRPAPEVAEHHVMCARPPIDKAQLAMAPQWQVVADFLSRVKAGTHDTETHGVAERPTEQVDRPETSDTMASIAEPVTAFSPSPGTPGEGRGGGSFEPINPHPNPPPAYRERGQERGALPTAAPTMRWAAEERESISEVIELPDAASTSGSILAAILRTESSDLIECPVTPPMCPEARLAVTRDRHIVLLAVARQGLGDMRSIGRAYNWLIENYSLIAMAVPQMAIDATASPRLRLLVDHADLSAEILQPMLQSSTVTVQAYRRLRWGTKTGLLLDAA